MTCAACVDPNNPVVNRPLTIRLGLIPIYWHNYKFRQCSRCGDGQYIDVVDESEVPPIAKVVAVISALLSISVVFSLIGSVVALALIGRRNTKWHAVPIFTIILSICIGTVLIVRSVG